VRTRGATIVSFCLRSAYCDGLLHKDTHPADAAALRAPPSTLRTGHGRPALTQNDLQHTGCVLRACINGPVCQRTTVTACPAGSFEPNLTIHASRRAVHPGQREECAQTAEAHQYCRSYLLHSPLPSCCTPSREEREGEKQRKNNIRVKTATHQASLHGRQMLDTPVNSVICLKVMLVL
jgi:hypothetical protein